METVSSRQLKHMQATNSIAEFYHLHMSNICSNSNFDISQLERYIESTQIVWLAIFPLLQKFDSLFQKTQTLPPKRATDHIVHLPPGAGLVNVRPYSYSYFQKREIERLISEMLNAGLIRHSTSAFPSRVLLVKRKMVAGISVLATWSYVNW